MPPFNKPASALTEADLLVLVEAAVPEDRHLEYKRELPGGNDEAKREFLADVSAFANTGGGTILYGVEEQGGVAHALPGVAPADLDAEARRLGQLLQSGLDPRLPSVFIHPVPLAVSTPGHYVLVVEVPRSLAAPHMVRSTFRFHARHGARKDILDTAELRAAFVGAEAFTQRVRAFHTDRLARILGGDTPLPRPSAAVFHLLPVASFTPGFRRDVGALAKTDRAAFTLLAWEDLSPALRHTFEGVLIYLGTGSDHGMAEQTKAYAEFYRNGCIEAVGTNYFYLDLNQKRSVVAHILAKEMIRTLGANLRLLTTLGVEPPYYALLSLLNVRDHALYNPLPCAFDLVIGVPVGRDHLLFPEVLIERPDDEPATLLRPTLDLLWNAFGKEHCPLYDAAGVFTTPG